MKKRTNMLIVLFFNQLQFTVMKEVLPNKSGREFQFPLLTINQLYSRERKLREFRESDVNAKISPSEPVIKCL